MQILLWVISVLLVLAGIAGTIVPALPGAPLVLGGMILAASLDHFERVGWWTLAFLTVLTLIAISIDFLASAAGAKKTGASGYAVAGATIGTLVGIFFGIPGLLFGTFVGALVGAFIARRDMLQATKVGFGTWLGLLVGTAVKLAVIFLMLGIFVTKYLI